MKRALTASVLYLLFQGLNAQALPDREADPIVLTGSQLPFYSSVAATQLVGFSRVAGGWVQIPIQVDEMELKDIVSGYGPLTLGTPLEPSPTNPRILFYSDPATYIGADTDPMFDENDELVIMLKDAGDEFSGSILPSGVVDGTCSQVMLTDPVSGDVGYVYLFVQDGSLQQDAGTSNLTYSSDVQSVAGWPAHDNGLNNEDTDIGSAHYAWHISAEWKSDELRIASGTNADILDRHKSFFANGNCGRSEDTFSQAENAYLTTTAGPLRVIRSVMGANSGPLTQRTHLFYEKRFDIITDLRVHSIPSVFDAFDYSPAANGMVYTNSVNGATSAVIDGAGTSDGLNVTGPLLTWEQVQGPQGTLSILHRKSTDINSVPTDNTVFMAYYDDNSAAPASNCTGDGQAWGTSGWGAVFIGGPTTDPIGDAGAPNLRYMQTTRIAYVDAPSVPGTTAQTYNTLLDAPVSAVISACTGGTVDVVEALRAPQLSLYPNPAREIFHVAADRPLAGIRISTMHGQVVSTVPAADARTAVPIGSLPSGVYIVQVEFLDGSTSTVRLVRE